MLLYTDYLTIFTRSFAYTGVIETIERAFQNHLIRCHFALRAGKTVIRCVYIFDITNRTSFSTDKLTVFGHKLPYVGVIETIEGTYVRIFLELRYLKMMAD